MVLVATAMATTVPRLFRGDDTAKVLDGAMRVTAVDVGIKRGGNFTSNNSRYGGNQQRWNTGRGGALVNRNRGQETEGALRGGIDADLLQQTVQAVVAAVTAATQAKDAPVAQPPVVHAVQGSEPDIAVGQVVEAPVAVPNSSAPQPLGTSQVIPDSTERAANDKENEGQGAPKKKKEDKAGCFRCKKPGHYIDDCPTPFCDICESIHHATSACHLLNAPKPTAILHGYANEGLMFVELACGVFKAKAENPKLAKVTVEGDNSRADSHADLLHRGASSGSVGVGIGDVGQQPAIGQVLSAAALAQHAANGLPYAGRQHLADPAVVWSPGAASHAANGHAAADCRLDASSRGRTAGAGSSAQRNGRSPAAAVLPRPQKIPPAEVGRSVLRTSDKTALGPMIGNSPGESGSAVLHNAMTNGVGLEPILSGSLGQSKRGITDKVLSAARGDFPIMGMKGLVGVASSPMSAGKPLDDDFKQ
ncbi:hypothetical protein ACQ4PT_041201 [Festuca glaucescens]